MDNDCDGIIDDNLSYIHSYEDSDSDNYGNPEVDSLSCELPIGFVEDDSDCDDTNPLIYPGADETVSYTHLRAHETVLDLVCRLLLEKKKNT